MPYFSCKRNYLKEYQKCSYSRDLRNCIVDQIERESGELSTKQDSKYFIRRKLLNYSFKLIKLLVLIEFIKLFISEKKINCIVIPQLDGFPYGGISSLCIKNNLFIGSSINRPPTLLLISKGYFNINCPIKADLEILRNLSDEKLDKKIEKIKLNYIKNKIWFIEPPNNKSKIIDKKVEYYKSIIDPSKKTGIVLTHVFTDQARPRLLNSWYENYLDWLIETINF